MKDVGEICTGLQSLSSTVTEVVGRLEMINAAPPSLGNVKLIVAQLITRKNCHIKLEDEMIFINERDNTWNVSEVTRYAFQSTHL